MITAACGLALLVAVNVGTICYAATREDTRRIGRVTTALAIFNVGTVFLLASLLAGGAP